MLFRKQKEEFVMNSDEFDICIKRITAINETLSQRLTELQNRVSAVEFDTAALKGKLQTEKATNSRTKEKVRLWK